MAVFELQDDIYLWLNRCITVVGLIVAILTLIWHSFKVHSELHQSKIEWTNSLTFSFVLQAFVVSLFGSGILWSWGQLKNVTICLTAMHLISNSYLTVKWSLYMILAFRLGLLPCTCIYQCNCNTHITVRVPNLNCCVMK